MVVVLVCVVLAAVGVAAIVAWGAMPIASPAPPPLPPGSRGRAAEVLRRYLWWATVVTAATFGAGVLAAGPGLRLAMRLLAVTTPDAKGALTEAGETVGEISVDGTVGLFVFGGLVGAFVASVGYVVLHRWLPAGRWGGLLLGFLALVVGSTRFDPLRAGNDDFDLLRPGWLAVAAFGAVVAATCMLVAAVAGWYSARLPLLSRDRRSWVYYLPLLLDVVLIPLAFMVVLGAAVTLAVALLVPRAAELWRSAPTVRAGRLVVAAAVVLSLPTFVQTLAGIVGD